MNRRDAEANTSEIFSSVWNRNGGPCVHDTRSEIYVNARIIDWAEGNADRVTHKVKGTMNRRSNQEKSNRKEKREPIGPLSAPARDYGDCNCRLTLEAIGRVGGPRKGIGRWKGSLLHQVSEPNSIPPFATEPTRDGMWCGGVDKMGCRILEKMAKEVAGS